MNHPDSPGAAQHPLRLLIPITARENSRWGIQYAMRLRQEGCLIRVVFLNVGEIVTDWRILRFRTQSEIARFQSERAQTFIDEASAPLQAQDIPVRGLFKQGEPAFCILDTAEELDCDRIVLPNPSGGVCSLFSRSIVGEIRRRNPAVQIVTVNKDGCTSDMRHN